MAARKRSGRGRVGRVSFYLHHGAWWLYYRDGTRAVRRRVGESREEAERVAAQVQAQLATSAPTLFSFEPLTVPELRDRFLAHHEDVLRSSLGTIRRYRAATQHLVDFAAICGAALPAHQLSPSRFATFLRERVVSPNGHPHTARRPLRDKGVRYIHEVVRSVYGFA